MRQPAQDAEQPVASPNFPQLLHASPSGSFDASQVKPHACMVNVVQRGNYIHCHNGNHGMRLPPGKVLVRDAATGAFAIQDQVIRNKYGKIVKA